MDANVLVKEYGLSPIHSSDQKKSNSERDFSHIVKPHKVASSPPKKKNVQKKPVPNQTLPVIQRPVENKTQKPNPLSESEKKKILNDLKTKLNNEMLAVLEEEQNKELERDSILEKTEDIEKKRELEKKFGFDRAMAQKRIQELSEFFFSFY